MTDFETCRRLTRENSKSFYFASFPLPSEKRDATYAIYAFCRTADDIVDEAPPGAEAEARRKLDELRRLLDDISSGAIPAHPLWGPLASTIHRWKVPVEILAKLVDGVESDLEPRRFSRFAELRDYCFSVASTVGLALCPIFEHDDDAALDYAANMGIAMQLTNIIRDVGADYRMGRIYLPVDELQSFGVSEAGIGEGVIDDAMCELIRFQIARAREYYRRAFHGIRYLRTDGSHWTAFLMGDVYRAILDEVERNHFDVVGKRAFVSLSRKVLLAARAPLTFRRDVLGDHPPIMSLPESET